MGAGVIMVVMLVVVMTILIGGGLYVKKMLVVTDPNTETTVDSKDASTAQEFLPFVDIDGSMIDLGNHRYRAIIECSSVNYNLKTDTERDVIELSYQKFISSLSFPVTFHIQTRVVDNTVIVRELEKDVERIGKENPTVYEYARTYLESMRNFDVYIGNVKQKKKYIIVGYEDAYVLGDLNDLEKKELSRQQLSDRVSFVISQLSSMQIKGHCLEEAELIDLLYNSYHREDAKYDISEMLGLGGYTTLSVTGEDKAEKMSVSEKIDLELLKVQNMIKEECLDSKLGYNEDVYKEASNIYNKVKAVRDSLGSPYETNYPIDVWVNKEKFNTNEVARNSYSDKVDNYSNNEVMSSRVEEVHSSENYSSNNNLNIADTENLRQFESKDLNSTNSNLNLDFGSSFDKKDNDVLSFEDDKTDDNWDLDFGSSFDKKDNDVLSFEDDKTDDNWDLDFGSSFDKKDNDVLSFEDDKTDDNWDLDFGSSFDKKDNDVLSFEDDKTDDNWDLDFGSSFDKKDNDVLSFEDDKADDNWDLDFGSSFDKKDNDVLSFEDDKADDNWDLDFGSSFDKKDNDTLDLKKTKGKKNNRLTMFD